MIPPNAATQNVRRAATRRSYSGDRARRWRRKNPLPAASAATPAPAASAPAPGTGAKLIVTTSAVTKITESTPPRLSTRPVVSLTCAGTRTSARTRAATASGRVSRNAEPHQKCCRARPASSGPSAVIAPPTPDHSAMARIRPGPDHSAVIRASVVG